MTNARTLVSQDVGHQKNANKFPCRKKKIDKKPIKAKQQVHLLNRFASYVQKPAANDKSELVYKRGN